jgi:hypothetical protein
MQESLVLFESVINSRWFLRTSVILFLNKIDVFKAKLPKVPLEKFFPEYTGGADINKAAKYILWRFTQTNRARLSVYPHLTQATDTSNARPSSLLSLFENARAAEGRVAHAWRILLLDVLPPFRSDWSSPPLRRRSCRTR